MWIADRWRDYELIDAGDGEKLERWGRVILQRPDPQAIWPRGDWSGGAMPAPDAVYRRSREGGGRWDVLRDHPRSWTVRYPSEAGELTFHVEPTGFKHTGLFPEQAVNWDSMAAMIRNRTEGGGEARILNLFAYTGAATAACAMAGADEVVHLDASKGMNAKARRNLESSGLGECRVRYFTDDARLFVEREIRRGRRYEGILMDPPAYGRGPSGELWKLEDALYGLVELCARLLSDDPLFFYINSYTTGLAPSVLADILSLVLGDRGGRAQAEEIGLPATGRRIVLPCGATGRWNALG
ncbi:MAG: class I SAM-dependent methyltransferase [Clostridia bacterium]|nr:class I SAM-dependent methyltransferase [Clostridia bacterium]